MTLGPSALPSDLAAALAALQAEREARLRVEAERDLAQLQATDWRAAAANARAEAANARAKLSDNEALIAHLELRIEKLSYAGKWVTETVKRRSWFQRRLRFRP